MAVGLTRWRLGDACALQVAAAIVAHRDAHGPFASRQQLLEVKGVGAKTFQNAAGEGGVACGSWGVGWRRGGAGGVGLGAGAVNGKG